MITALWQSVDHFLHGIILLLPSCNVRVHVLDESPWRRSLHFVDWYVLPLAVCLLQVLKEPFDFELTGSKLSRGQTVVFYVESNRFLRDVLMIGVELQGKEFGNTFCSCIYIRHSFILNNNKQYLFYY